MRKNGFTVVEVIAAITIFALAMIAVLEVMPKAIQTSREAKETSVATDLAQEKIEEYLAQSYDDIDTGTVEPRAAVDTDPASQFHTYNRTVVVNLLDANMNNTNTDVGLKKISVTVDWISIGKQESVNLVRLIQRP